MAQRNRGEQQPRSSQDDSVELARRHVKVVLTGEGADETLAGYNVFQHIALLEEVRTHPRDRERRAALETLLRQRDRQGSRSSTPGYYRSERCRTTIASLACLAPIPTPWLARCEPRKNFHSSCPAIFAGRSQGFDPIAEMAERIGHGRMKSLSPVAAHQYYLFKTDMPSYNLSFLRRPG